MRADGEIRLPGATELRPVATQDAVGLVTAGGRYFVRAWSSGAGPPAAPAPEDLRADAPADEAWAMFEVLEEATCAAVAPSDERVALGSACGEVVVLDGAHRRAVQGHATAVADVMWLAGGALASLGTDGLCRRWRPDEAVGDPEPGPRPPPGAPPPLAAAVARLAEAPLDAQLLRGLAGEVASSGVRGVTVLRACLQDPRPRVRYRTLWLLGVDGLWGFADELVNALHDVNETVRGAAVGAIDELDEVACADALRALIGREVDRSVRDAAGLVLERFVGEG